MFDILRQRKEELDGPVKECIDSLSQENLLYYIMGAEANVLHVYYAMDVYTEREEKLIFFQFMKCLIINSHIQKEVSLGLIQTDLERLKDMHFDHITEACLMISNSCRYMFNEKARLHWWKASECLPRLVISGIVEMDELIKRFEQIAIEVIEKINDLIGGLETASASVPTNAEIITYLEKRFEIKNILPRVVDTKSTIYLKQYDKQRFVSIDVIQSNWTALGILSQMILQRTLSPFEEIVKSVVTDIFKDISDKTAKDWLCSTFIHSKILRNYSFHKSRANKLYGSTVAMIVKCIVSISHHSTLYLQGKIDDGLRLIYRYDELIVRSVCGDEAETNEKFGIALDKLKGIVRYEQYTIHALYNPKGEYIGVCRKMGNKIDLKSVNADNLLHAYEYINSKL